MWHRSMNEGLIVKTFKNKKSSPGFHYGQQEVHRQYFKIKMTGFGTRISNFFQSPFFPIATARVRGEVKIFGFYNNKEKKKKRKGKG